MIGGCSKLGGPENVRACVGDGSDDWVSDCVLEGDDGSDGDTALIVDNLSGRSGDTSSSMCNGSAGPTRDRPSFSARSLFSCSYGDGVPRSVDS